MIDYKFKPGTREEFKRMMERDFAPDKLLVMSKYQIAEDSPEATGTRITVRDAVELFGVEILYEIVDRGAALLPGAGD
jgi:hypothetical protein